MLSGNAPFYSRSRTDPNASVMQRIRDGDFRFEGDAWKAVSGTAKNLTKGLLTVDPRKRLSMDQLRSSPWLQGCSSSLSSSTGGGGEGLSTPAVLAANPTTGRRLKQTYNAFHNATREGFRLSPISSASSKLLQKRKQKTTSQASVSSEVDSGSGSGSDRSSYGSKSSLSSISQASSTLWSEAIHGDKSSTASSKNPNNNLFSFKSSSSQVQQFFTSLTASSRGGPAAGPPSLAPSTGHYTHPLMSRTPITAPLTVQVPDTSFSRSSHSSGPSVSSTLIPFYPGSSSSGLATLSVIQTDLDVISPASTSHSSHSASSTPRTCSGAACTCGCSASGPITRSRKRRLQDTAADGASVVGRPQPEAAHLHPANSTGNKDKCRRTGTITIE